MREVLCLAGIACLSSKIGAKNSPTICRHTNQSVLSTNGNKRIIWVEHEVR